MIKINLLAERKNAKTKAKTAATAGTFEVGGTQNLLLAGILVIGVLVSAAWWWTRSAELNRVRVEKISAEAELKRLEDVRKKAEAFKTQKELLERKINLITELKKKQAVPVHILDQVSRNLPEFMWLDSLTANANSLNIVGKATTYNAVSNLYDNLRTSGQFSDVVLGKTTEISDGVSFSLTCRFSPPGTAPADSGAAAPPAPQS